MARLLYSAIASLDGYVADESGDFSWGMPSEELHAFVNDLERPIGTYLYGRRMYETMVAWETMATEGEPAVIADYAEIWRGTGKIVFSTTLREATSSRTTIEPEFDPAAIRALKERASADLSIGGPHLAAQALEAGLVDECNFFLCPVVIGGGNRALPDGVRLDLELQSERRFPGGFVHLAYAL